MVKIVKLKNTNALANKKDQMPVMAQVCSDSFNSILIDIISVKCLTMLNYLINNFFDPDMV